MLKKMIFLPVGSYEYHGDLLPADTDSLIATRVANNLSAIYSGSILLPVLNYGISTEHGDFNSTVTVDSLNYLSFMTNLLSSIKAQDALIVVINGHGGNVNILGALESDYNYKNISSKIFIPTIYSKKVKIISETLFGEFDTHAGSVETSLMAYYGYTDKDNITIHNKAYIKRIPSSLRFFKTKQVNKTGVIKNTSKLIINSKLGQELHGVIIEQLQTEIDNLLVDINKVMK